LPARNLHSIFSFEFSRVHILLRRANEFDQAETVGPVRAFVFDDVHALLNKMETKPARLYFFERSHAEIRLLDRRPMIAQQYLDPVGSLGVGLFVDGTEEHFNRLVLPAFVRVPDDIGQRFVDSASDGPTLWLGKSERFRQAFHCPAHRAEQTGIALKLQLQEQTAAPIHIWLLSFVSPLWMIGAHLNLNLATGFDSPAE
jgi:hypothetical protein